ncbi:short-chain fatty acid transporter [Echinicola rosea]|uniref:Short-chain fatty acid transporter n=1 Tax=Echinicola rosea TaxID=1807691 RepID=A0ABQ1V546_9BACT|nr:TIGR00366 family protein [Echinicola rosea]GGF37081.1 short-chain fatty acid transporter [Echinicola rosea]
MPLKKQFQKLPFPTPFGLALLLSVCSVFFAVVETRPADRGVGDYTFQVLSYWKDGFWGLLAFSLQMVLILVFGHVLAISTPISKLLDKVATLARSNTHAVMLTGGVTMLAGYFNWGFGLILGAVLAKKMGEAASKSGLAINYPLVASSGYLGMMVWHGGFSGSAPLKVAEPGHFLEEEIGVVPISETLLSTFNITLNAMLVLVMLGLLYWLANHRKFNPKYPVDNGEYQLPKGKDKLGWVVGGVMCLLAASELVDVPARGWGFISLNYINFLLFGMGLIFHKSLASYVGATAEAMKGATGIVLQFPFYAGILGVLKSSGLLVLVAHYFVRISSPETFPFLAFFSSGLINLFVPSGGGQWAVQGPVIVAAAKEMELSIPAMVMVMAYGDEITNMLQPFWALPLLAITGISPREMLKFTAFFFLVGTVVFIVGIYLFLG